MATMVKRLSHQFVVLVLRVRFPLVAPLKNLRASEGFLVETGIEHELHPPRRLLVSGSRHPASPDRRDWSPHSETSAIAGVFELPSPHPVILSAAKDPLQQ